LLAAHGALGSQFQIRDRHVFQSTSEAVVAGSAESDLHHQLDDVLASQLHDPLGATRPQLRQLVVQPVCEGPIALAHRASEVCLEFLEFGGEPKTTTSARVHQMPNVLEHTMQMLRVLLLLLLLPFAGRCHYAKA
jgi:hypothetical protein